MSYDPNHDVKLLVEGMVRFADPQPDGTYKTTFGKIFKDEILEQQLESLVRENLLLHLNSHRLSSNCLRDLGPVGHNPSSRVGLFCFASPSLHSPPPSPY